ncbi:MAG: hypothetical protein M3139_01195 [Bacteroidota bacterium]|nr:hypothetical protein [Bacteroidota bacterium]
MTDNTGMTERDYTKGKTADLTPAQAKAENAKLKAEKNAPAPTKSAEAADKAREKKKNASTNVLLKHKPV